MFVKLDRELTKDDIGKKVKLRNGEVGTIIKTASFEKYPFVATKGLMTSSGSYWHVDEGPQKHKFDIVEIFKEVVTYDENYDTAMDLEIYSNNPTIQINIQEGMSVIKGNFKDSNGEEWYVTLDKV